MIEERERYERAFQQFQMPEPAWNRLVDRRDRKRRNKRITAGVVGIAVFVAAVWIVTSGVWFDRTQTPAVPGGAETGPAVTGPAVPLPSTRVGFIGVPPEGAAPGTPEREELVLSYWSSPFRMWVYADGRLIWVRHGDFPYGANNRSTGYLEQRLTPEGAELMRSEVIAAGLFGRDLDLIGIQGLFGEIEIRNGDRLVRVAWGDYSNDPDPTIATTEQASALQRLDARLADPASWLPASAWEDPEIRAYVPSRFSVCYQGMDDPLRAPRILASLPPAAADLLRSTDRIRMESGPSVDGEGTRYWVQYCSEVTTEEARALAEAFDDDPGFEKDPVVEASGLVYQTAIGPSGTFDPIVSVAFEPILPHGDWTCSPCG
jgi:hypothetical protein